jgi:hypothetical protein
MILQFLYESSFILEALLQSLAPLAQGQDLLLRCSSVCNFLDSPPEIRVAGSKPDTNMCFPTGIMSRYSKGGATQLWRTLLPPVALELSSISEGSTHLSKCV